MNGKKDMVVYVKLDEYNEIKEIIKLIRTKLKQARALLGVVSELKSKEEAELASISSEIAHVEERVNTADRALTEPEL